MSDDASDIGCGVALIGLIAFAAFASLGGCEAETTNQSAIPDEYAADFKKYQMERQVEEGPSQYIEYGDKVLTVNEEIKLYIDPETGCHYLVPNDPLSDDLVKPTGITPRLGQDGKPYCQNPKAIQARTGDKFVDRQVESMRATKRAPEAPQDEETALEE